MRSTSWVLRASDSQCRSRSQHPLTQWNLRGSRWSSVEYRTLKIRKRNNPPLTKYFFADFFPLVNLYSIASSWPPSPPSCPCPPPAPSASRTPRTTIFPPRVVWAWITFYLSTGSGSVSFWVSWIRIRIQICDYLYGFRFWSCSFSLSYASYYNIPTQIRVSVDHFLPILRIRICNFLSPWIRIQMIICTDPDLDLAPSASRTSRTTILPPRFVWAWNTFWECSGSRSGSVGFVSFWVPGSGSAWLYERIQIQILPLQPLVRLVLQYSHPDACEPGTIFTNVPDPDSDPKDP